ncbi:hypothetical protein OAU50_08670, partial [Planctomycetota bacterium]|nr:hypothetical protein [Planctomycetota bacterium]
MPTRFSALNMILLVVTVFSLMFGAWGFIANTEDSGNTISRSSNSDESSPDDTGPVLIDQPRTASNIDKTDNRIRVPHSTNSHNSSNNSDTLPPTDTFNAVKSAPSDSGDASISGRVMTADSTKVGGAIITARRSDLTLTPPTFEGGNITEFRTKVSAFLARANKESRTTTSNQEGEFSFTGLDGNRSYDISVSTELYGDGKAERVAAGDAVTILLKGTQLLIGKVQTEDGQALSEFTVKV